MVLHEFKDLLSLSKMGQVGNDVKVKITSIGNRFAKAELVTENTDT